MPAKPVLMTRARARQTSPLFVFTLFLFAVWTMVAMTQTVSRADWTVAVFLQRFASSALDRFGSIITVLGNAEVTALLALLFAIVLSRSGHPRAAVDLIVVFIGGSILELVGKHWWPHPGVPPWMRHPALNHWHYMWAGLLRTPFGYPSGHAFRTTLLVGAVWRVWFPAGLWRRRMRYGLLVVPALMGLALIYLGDHWLSEVIGGYLLGITGLGLLRLHKMPGLSGGLAALPRPVEDRVRGQEALE